MRKSTILLGFISAVCAASTLWMWRELRNEQARADSLEFDLAQFDSPRGSPSAAPPIAAPAKPEPAASAAAPAVSNAARESEFPPAGRPAGNYAGQQRRLLANPEYRKAFRNQQRSYIEFAFRDLPKVLNLSPEKAAQVFDLMADQSVSQYVEQPGKKSAMDDDGADRRREFEERRRKNDADMAELLGPSGMNQLQEFRNSMQSRSEVNQVRSELSASPEPLREDQYEPMLAVIYAEQQRVDQELRDFASTGSSSIDTRRTELAVAANARIVDAARSVLSTTQLAALTDFYRRQNQQMKSQSEMTRLQVEAMIKDAQASKPN